MDFATLKATVAENVKGSRINLAQNALGRVVNRALEYVVNHVEQSAKFYNISTAAIEVSVVAGTTSYQISSSSIKIRKIYFAERTDVSGVPVTVTIIQFREKNRFNTGSPVEDVGVNRLQPAVFFQRERDGEWYMRFPQDPAGTMTIKVYYVPLITELDLDADVPTEVPEQHHDLIAMRATKVVLNQYGMNAAAWDENYRELLQLMSIDLETWNRTGPRVRRLHVNHA